MPVETAPAPFDKRLADFGVMGGGVFFTIQGLAGPFFTLYATELGASTTAIGLIVTCRALFPFVIAMTIGELIDSVGPVKILKYGSWLMLASLACTILANGLLLLGLSQVLIGTAVIMMASSFQVLVSQGDRERRNEAIKRYSMWMSGGGMLGPIIGGLIATLFSVPFQGYRAAFATALVAWVGFMLVLYWFAARYAKGDGGRVRIRDAFRPTEVLASYKGGIGLLAVRPVQFGLIGTFLVMYIQALYMSFLPLYLSQNGFSTFLISLNVSLEGLAGMLSRFALTGLMRRSSLEAILLVAGAVASTGVILTPLAVGNVGTMLLLAALVGAAVGVNLPVSIMIMVDAVGETRRGKLMGLRLLVNRLSQMASPAMFGALGQLFGLTTAFYCGGALLGTTMAGFAIYTVRRVPLQAEPVDETT